MTFRGSAKQRSEVRNAGQRVSSELGRRDSKVTSPDSTHHVPISRAHFSFLLDPQVGDGGIIVLDTTLDASTTDDAEWELAGGPPSPCDVSFFNDNVLINGRSNLSRTPRNHKVSKTRGSVFSTSFLTRKSPQMIRIFVRLRTKRRIVYAHLWKT